MKKNNYHDNKKRKFAAILAILIAFTMVLSIAVPIASVLMS